MAALPAVVTANETETGTVVYRTPDGRLSPHLSDAWVAEDAERLEAALAELQAQQAIVCDPYAFPVKVEAGVPMPLSTRERIRSQGPTVALPQAS